MNDTENNNGAAISEVEVSAISAPDTPDDKGGRPTLYSEETINRLLAALADGLTIKQSCAATGISESTLRAWREKYPELGTRMTEAREQSRQKAFAGIKAAGEAGDWRAWESFLRHSFYQDYRKPDTNIDVTATAANGFLVVTEDQQRELQARRAAALRDRRNNNGITS